MTEEQEKRIIASNRTGLGVYIFLYFILLSSCSGPSSNDIKELGIKIDKLSCNAK